MKHSTFPGDGVWLKGNLHSHSTVSDGVFEPAELAELYTGQGYDFLSMTDHNVYVSHRELPEERLILLTGLEHDIEYDTDHCVHLTGIGPVGKEKTDYVCRQFGKDEITAQELVDLMRGDGQFVTLAHPVWSRMLPEEVLALKNVNAVEVYNNGTEHLCHGGNAEVYWDLMLRMGRHVYASACDDVHVREDLFGGWIWVKAARRSPEAIMEALCAGRFYASSGPRIYDFGLEEDDVYVSCSPCREIHFVSWPPRGKSFFAEENGTLTGASRRLTGRENYVRAVCVDERGRAAWSQPIFLRA